MTSYYKILRSYHRELVKLRKFVVVGGIQAISIGTAAVKLNWSL